MKKHFLASLLTVLLVLPVISLAQTDEDIDPITTANTCTNLTYDLRITSRDSQTGGQVSDLQFFLQTKGYLNTEPTGYFGLLTATAVKQFQTANGISPLGYVGPLTRTKINSISCNNISSGTANLTTPTNTTTSSIVGCTPGALFSSTTGAPCSTIAPTVVTPTIQSTSSQVSSSYQGYIFSYNLTLNDKGTDVLMLQSFLEAKGFFAKSSYLKGTFDVNTKNALAKYQTSVGISPADGSFGPITRAQIMSMIVSVPTTISTTSSRITVIAPTSGTYKDTDSLYVSWTPYTGDFDRYYVMLGNNVANSGEITLTPDTSVSKNSSSISISSKKLQGAMKGIVVNSGGKTAEQIKNSYYIKVIAEKSNNKKSFMAEGTSSTFTIISPPVSSHVDVILTGLGTNNVIPGDKVALYAMGLSKELTYQFYVKFNDSIVTTVPATLSTNKSYLSFTIPNLPSGSYNVSLGAYDNFLSVNSLPLTITNSSTNEPSLKITSQTSDETWPMGGSYNVSWQSSNVSGNIVIGLFKGAGGICVIGNFQVNDQSATLNIPVGFLCTNTNQPLTTGTYTISSYVNVNDGKNNYNLNASSVANVNVVSDNTTNKYKSGPFVILTSQKSDETWESGNQYQVKWDHIYPELSGKLHAILVSDSAYISDITYCDLGYVDITKGILTVNLSSNTKCNKSGQTPGALISGKYRVKLYDEQIIPTVKGGYEIAVSKGWVNISIPSAVTTCSNNAVGTTVASTTANPLSINILSPNGGEVAVIGQTCRITWSSTPNIDKVTLGVSVGSGHLDWLGGNSYNIPNTGYYDWMVSGNGTATKIKFYIIGYQTGVGSAQDYSDEYVTMSK